jgi:hypothetical protein
VLEDLQSLNGVSDAMDLLFESPIPGTLNDFSLEANQALPSHVERPMWNTKAPYTTCKCCRLVNISNEILGQCSKMQLRNTANQRLRDADIPIRAILHGWNAVTKKYSLDPLWAALRHADEIIFSKCAATERLVVLHILCLILRVSMPCSQNSKV